MDVRVNGDHIEGLCNFYRSKAISVASNETRLMIYALVTFISVLIPLAVIFDSDLSGRLELLKQTIAPFLVVLWLGVIFLKFKYYEYDGKQKELLVRNMINHAYCSANKSYGGIDAFLGESGELICNHVIYATGMERNEANTLVGRTKGYAQTLKMYCAE